MYPWLCAAKVYTGFGKGVRQPVGCRDKAPVDGLGDFCKL